MLSDRIFEGKARLSLTPDHFNRDVFQLTETRQQRFVFTCAAGSVCDDRQENGQLMWPHLPEMEIGNAIVGILFNRLSDPLIDVTVDVGVE